MRNGGAVGACLALVVVAELFFAWRSIGVAPDEAPPAAVSYSKEPQACAEQSPWFVCAP